MTYSMTPAAESRARMFPLQCAAYLDFPKDYSSGPQMFQKVNFLSVYLSWEMKGKDHVLLSETEPTIQPHPSMASRGSISYSEVK